MFKAFILMLQFFTRLPINTQIDMDSRTLSRGAFFFPFVGAIVGSIAALIYYVFTFVSIDIASLAAVFSIIFITGGIHVDGLSDTADGFFSARSRERVLEIMKDSRVGTFGVIAIVFDILIKYVLIKNIPVNMGIPAIIFSCVLGRASAAMLINFGKCARPGGLGDMFSSAASKIYFVSSMILMILIGFILFYKTFLLVVTAALISTLMIMRLSYRIIGGLTGDVYGASIEIGEIVSLTVFMVVSLWK